MLPAAGAFCFGGGTGATDLGWVLTGEMGSFLGAVAGTVGCADLGPVGLASVSKLDRFVGVDAPDLGTSTGLLSVFFGNSADLAIEGTSRSSERCFFLSK